MPDLIQRLRDTYASNPAAALKMIPELFQAEEEGKIVEVNEKFALAMNAGKRAIENSRQYKSGGTYIYDIFGNAKEIPYYEAANILRYVAEQALKERET